jgi:SAM-dependent methyltransferase
MKVKGEDGPVSQISSINSPLVRSNSLLLEFAHPMISRSNDYVEYCRETATHLKTLHDLALRGTGKEEITAAISQRIIEEVDLGPGDDLVDIGCGDGTLLRLAEKIGVRSALGFLATEEEVALVRAAGLNVGQAFSDRLPVPDASASVVVCNSVLLIVPREKVLLSLREMHRITRPRARIFVGEIPFVPGPPLEPQFDSSWQTLAFLYRKHGLRTCLGMARRIAYWKVSGKPTVIHDGSQISFHATTDEFLALARGAGLTPVRHWRHEHWETRNNFLFTKAAV